MSEKWYNLTHRGASKSITILSTPHSECVQSYKLEKNINSYGVESQRIERIFPPKYFGLFLDNLFCLLLPTLSSSVKWQIVVLSIPPFAGCVFVVCCWRPLRAVLTWFNAKFKDSRAASVGRVWRTSLSFPVARNISDENLFIFSEFITRSHSCF